MERKMILVGSGGWGWRLGDGFLHEKSNITTTNRSVEYFTSKVSLFYDQPVIIFRLTSKFNHPKYTKYKKYLQTHVFNLLSSLKIQQSSLKSCFKKQLKNVKFINNFKTSPIL